MCDDNCGCNGLYENNPSLIPTIAHTPDGVPYVVAPECIPQIAYINPVESPHGLVTEAIQIISECNTAPLPNPVGVPDPNVGYHGVIEMVSAIPIPAPGATAQVVTRNL